MVYFQQTFWHRSFCKKCFQKGPKYKNFTKVHGVLERETCFAVAQATGLTLKQFLSFNPNIICQKLFIGQWVCLDAAHA